MRIKLLIVLFLLSTQSFSQNLVNNPGFEKNTGYPNNSNELKLATGWGNCNGTYGPTDSYGTPDYYSTLGCCGSQLPGAGTAYINPHSGNCIMGEVLYDGEASNYREYAQTFLTSALVVGKIYTVSLYVSIGDADQVSEYLSNNLGILFSVDSVTQSYYSVMPRTPQINMTSVVSPNGWEQYSFTFFADSAYNYITIGNFYDDASTTLVDTFNTNTLYAYYFFDDISVTTDSTPCNETNIVNNPGFENHTAWPTETNELDLCDGWSNCNGDYGGNVCSSPDYLSTMGSGYAQLPDFVLATVYPHSGYCAADFVTYNGGANYREYIRTYFTTPMIAGQTYNVSFYLTTGANQISEYNSNNAGVLFSTDSVTNCESVIPLTPQINISSVIDTPGWKQYSFKYTADSAYKYITFGNFYTDGNTTLIQSNNNSGDPYAIMFIDDISVGLSSGTLNASVVPANDTLCSGSSVTLKASGGTSYLWNTTATTDSITVTPPKDSVYTVLVSAGSCNATDTVRIKVNPSPVVAVTPPDSLVCNGLSVPLTATGTSSYQWSPSIGLNATTGSAVVAAPPATTTYTVYGTNTAGCTDTVTAVVNIIPNNIVITVTPKNSIICLGNTAQFTATGGENYSWLPSKALNETTGDSVIANPTSTTIYTVIGTGLGNCADTTQATLVVSQPPVLDIAPATPKICIGQSISLTVKGASTYEWSPSTGLSQTNGSAVTANPTATTTYTTYGTDSVGCNDSAKVRLIVNPLPVVTIAPPDSAICRGYSVTLTGSGAATYQWSPSTGLNSTTNSTIIANPSVTTTYKVTGTSLPGCIDSTTVAIRVVQDSLKVAIKDTTVCQGNSAVLTATGAYRYSWSPSTGLNNTTGDAVTATPFSTTSYTLIATGAIGCLDTQNVVVNVNLPPALTITPPISAICIGHPTSLSVSGASTYYWSPAKGLNQTNGSAVSANPTGTTTYTVYGTDVHGCNDSTKVVVNVNPLPVVTLYPLDSIVCNGLSVPLTATGAPTDTYIWSPVSGLNATTGSAVVAAPLATTTYTVYGTNTLGCVDTVSAVVNIIPNTIVITVTPGNSIICQGNSASLYASGGINYLWSPSTDLMFITDSSVLVYPSTTATYTVIGIGIGYCTDTTNAIIRVSPPPTLSIQPSSPTKCEWQDMLIKVSGASSYIWEPATGLYETVGTIVNAYDTATTSYTVYGVDSIGCDDSLKFTLAVKKAPSNSFTTSVPFICNPLQIQFANTTTGGTSYLWNFGDGDSSEEQNPVHTFPKTGTYNITLISTAENGCTDTITSADTLPNTNANVFIPNSFTPSMPGVNQLFKPNIVCTSPSNYIFKVYDRWGQLIFETADPEIGWDGTYRGKEQPLGVYVYYLQVTCGACDFFKKGDVTLLR